MRVLSAVLGLTGGLLGFYRAGVILAGRSRPAVIDAKDLEAVTGQGLSIGIWALRRPVGGGAFMLAGTVCGFLFPGPPFLGSALLLLAGGILGLVAGHRAAALTERGQ